MTSRRRRVLVALETQWDRMQFAACRAAWEGGAELVFGEPCELDCPLDFDVLGWIGAALAGRFGPIDAVFSSSDYPGAALAAVVASARGLPGARPEAVLTAGHKFYSRRLQERAAPEAVPRFALLDPRRPGAPAPLCFPFFVKPVKGAFSRFARRVDSQAELDAFLTSPDVQLYARDYVAVFDRLLRAYTGLELDAGHFLAEELIRGELVTVEGFVQNGEVQILGIVDSDLHPETGSFQRFDYPSRLPEAVQERMAGIAARTLGAHGLDHTLFNLEMAWDAASDRISIVELNPRLCGQFGDLYQKVDGVNGFEVALALALGEKPRLPRRQGAHAAAASFPLRVYRPSLVVGAPDRSAIAAAESRFPGAQVWSECRPGDRLDDFASEDGWSRRYAVVNLGGESRADLAARLGRLCAELGYQLEPL